MSEEFVLRGPGGADLILGSLSQKQSTGSRLTSAEILMGMTSAARKMADSFGPSPSDMRPPEQILPESLKGALASARI